MPRPKPNKLHDELDALLDGRPVELTDELAPLVEAADALRAELAALELDPAVADRHLERVLQGSATVVQLPPRRQANGWDLRRRVAAVALAAALVLAPATMASAAALPGQAMYPFKLAIEQLRIASVQWSPSREAGERTRVADERLGEVQDLFRLRMFNQLPDAVTALGKAVVAAQVAVREAAEEGEPVSAVVADRLNLVEAAGGQVVERVAVAAATGSVKLPQGTRDAIQAAVAETRDVLTPDRIPNEATPTPGTSAGPGGPGPGPTNATQPPPPPTSPPTTEAPPPPTSTTPPTTEPPTTEPPTTESTATPGSAGGGDTGGAERTPAGDVPPTTLEVPGP
ncbi:MAG TPA: hypothetical protein VFL71_23965 [Actinomycetes bacterium]|nr:hypothetical protein [Actinomycetes bacterium]